MRGLVALVGGADSSGSGRQHRGPRCQPGVETQTCLPRLAEALLRGELVLEAPAEMGGSGSCCRGVRWGCCRDGGVRKAQGWRGQEATAFSVSMQGMLCC